MRIDGIQLAPGSSISNMVVASGLSFPGSPDEGEMFFRVDTETNVRGLYCYIGGGWDRIASSDSLTSPLGGSFPGASNAGDLFYLDSNTGTEGLYVFNGGSWVAAAAAAPATFTVTGDVTGTLDGGTDVLTLASVNANVGTVGTAAAVSSVTLNAKGLVTAASQITIAIAASQVTSGTFADARISQSSVTQHASALSLSASQIGSGTFADARIAQSNVTQHQGALSLAETQITDGSILARVAGNETVTGTWEFSNPIIVGAPTASTHATTKSYVDAVAQGLTTKPSVRVATTANLTATYDNGTAGVGATLTGAGSLPAIDGITLTVGNGVLVKNQTTTAHNGRYNVTTLSPWVLTRCSLCDEATEIPGAFVFVNEGTQAATGWVQTVANVSTFAVGTDPITVTQFSGAGSYVGGAGLTLTGNTFAVGTASASRIVINADTIDLATAGTAVSNSAVRITTDAYGRVTATSALAGADITTALGFVPVNRVTTLSDWNAPTNGEFSLISGFANSVNGVTVISGAYFPHGNLGYGMELAGRQDNLYLRTEEADVWSSWKTVLHSSNFNTYALPLTGGTLTGDLTLAGSGGSAYTIYNTATPQYRGMQLRTASATRWFVGANNNPETGSNAGSDFQIVRHDDTGTAIDTPFQITRTSGLISSSSSWYFSRNTPVLSMNTTASGQSCQIDMRTGNLIRWALQKSNAAEAGANAGSNFTLLRYDDAGTLLDTTLQITRSSGALGIGGAPGTGIGLNLLKTITGGASAHGILVNGQVQSDVTTTGYYYRASMGVAAAAAAGTLAGFTVSQGTIGAGATVSAQYGFLVDSSMTGGTTNTAFIGNLAAATGRWNFFGNGSAQNYFLGNVGIGAGKSVPATALDVNGTVTATAFVGSLTGAASLNVLKAGDTMTGDLIIQNAVDGVTQLGIVNTNTTGTAAASFVGATDGTNSVFLGRYNAGHATRANTSWLATDTNVPLVFGTNNTERMRLTSTGLGIGTTATTAVHLKQDQNNATLIRVENANAGTAAYYGLILNDGTTNKALLAHMSSGFTTSAQYVQDSLALNGGGVGGVSLSAANAGGVIRFYSGGTAERARFDTAGNLVIGGATAYEKLDITAGGIHLAATNTNVGMYLRSLGDNELSISGGAQYNTFSSPNYVFTARSTAASGMRSAAGEMVFWGNTGLTAGTTFNTTEILRITPTGRLAIGSAGAALTRLDVRNADAFSTVVSNTSLNDNTSTVARFSFTTDPVAAITAGTGVGIALSPTPNRGETFLVSTHPTASKDASDFSVWTTAGGVSAERLRVDSAGNVSIGQASVSDKLELGGPNPYIRVNSTGFYGGIKFFSNQSGTNRLNGQILQYDGNGLLIDSGASMYLGFRPAGTEAMRLTASGETLIGRAASSGLGVLQTDGSVDFAKTTGNQFLAVRAASTFSSDVMIAANGVTTGAGEFLLRQSASLDAYVWNRSAGVLFLGTSGVERMRISATNADVGIGGSPNTNGANWGTLTVNGASGGIVEFNAAGTRYGQVLGTSAELRLSSIGALPINFQTNGTNQRMVITASGQIGMGGNTSGTAGGLSHVLAINYPGAGTMYGIALKSAANTTTAVSFVNASDAVIGNITSGASSVAYNTTSDARLKKNVQPADSFGAVIDAINVVSFDWKVDDEHQRAGFIAQELHEVAPEAVKVGDTNDTVTEPWAVDPSKLVAMLVKEIQELRARVAALENV